jgi:Zn finger protein HypA/HybF involved in hydrogenase expression
MDVPKVIEDAINEGITCPLCNEDNLIIVVCIDTVLNFEYYQVHCPHCHKNVVISYKEEPFEIVSIDEWIY